MNSFFRIMATGLLAAASAGRARSGSRAGRRRNPSAWSCRSRPAAVSDVAARVVSRRHRQQPGPAHGDREQARASGAIASDIVYSAAPDGYTLLLGTADTQAMNPHVNKVKFDSMKYVPIGGVAKVPYVLVGRGPTCRRRT